VLRLPRSLALLALAAAPVAACATEPATTPTSTVPVGTDSVVDPCTLPAPGTSAVAPGGGDAPTALPRGDTRPPDTRAVSEACREGGGAVQGPGPDQQGGGDNGGSGQQPGSGGLGDTGSGGATRGPGATSDDSPPSSVESERPPAAPPTP
jgi:hypothetical protein